ncbi:MAG: hypothetical protein GY953_47595, partial [bacterium]|nr:hypothetical protein [bacterium]
RLLGVKPTSLRRRARMDIHKNARSCPASRELLVRRVLREGWGVSQAAEAAGMSKRTASSVHKMACHSLSDRQK